jgi:CheY-like chemotaxis protein
VPLSVKLMDDMNCEIAVEHNGEDAIRRAATFQSDIGFIGFVMPGMDGSATGSIHTTTRISSG